MKALRDMLDEESVYDDDNISKEFFNFSLKKMENKCSTARSTNRKQKSISKPQLQMMNKKYKNALLRKDIEIDALKSKIILKDEIINHLENCIKEYELLNNEYKDLITHTNKHK